MLRVRNSSMASSLALGFLLAFTGCSAPGPHRAPGEEQAIAESLYFGSFRPDGMVTDEEWQAFVVREITPRFPHGLTSWQASGQWLSGAGVLQRERSFVLHIIHPDTPKDEQAIREIIATYRRAFQQESVLRVRSTVWISF
jgi:hypothetical protein